MQAGKLDRRITIQRATESRGSLNSALLTWSDLVTVWAEKLDVSDVERVRAKEQGAEITTRFRIRHSSDVADVNPKDRVSYDGRIYAISAVKEIGRRDGLELTTAARAD